VVVLEETSREEDGLEVGVVTVLEELVVT